MSYQNEAEKFKRLLDAKAQDFTNYRGEMNLERERDIIKSSEGILSTQLAEMIKKVSNLEKENNEMTRQTIINEIRGETWREKLMDEVQKTQEREAYLAMANQITERERINQEIELSRKEKEIYDLKSDNKLLEQAKD